ncbi:MAG: hypothetical protein D3917_10825 [Candidatus Electrothrix sp. AX5]|nr:hypothetical protein [Candidatus Electrothrix sp. AX5]
MIDRKADITAIFGKGLFGAIPFVGPLVAEIIGTIIPNQRIDRIESLLRLLESKILEDDKEKVKQRIVSPEYVDLMEDGFWQAARALSEERKDYIASLLKNSLTDDELKYIEYKRLMSILGELNDFEILILKSMSMNRWGKEYNKFWKMHGHLLELPSLVLGEATEERIDKQAIYGAHTLHLTNLGLLKNKASGPIETKSRSMSILAAFDQETKVIKAEDCDITRLGKLLLRSIDQAAPVSNT